MIHSSSHTSTWSRRHALIGAGVLGLGASIGRIPDQVLASQDTPDDVVLGVVTEILCSGESATVPGKSLALMRLTVHPGTATEAHAHPGPVALYVVSGVLGTEFLEGQGLIERAHVDWVSQGRKEMQAGDDTRMSAGEHLFHDGAVHTISNDGDESLVLLVSTLVDTGVSEFIEFKHV